MRHLLIRDLSWELDAISRTAGQKGPEYLEWIGSNLDNTVEEFAKNNKLPDSSFVKYMNRAFNTDRFGLLLKKWLAQYFLKLFDILNEGHDLVLEDNPLNRFGVEKYYSGFGVLPKIKWRKNHNLMRRIISILSRIPLILYLSLNRGLKISAKRKTYKVMREALWGLYDVGGYYFHDDFLVDADMIRKEELLLFSRGAATESGRLKAYSDAKRSPYAHFDLHSLSLGIKPLFLRVAPKYIIGGTVSLFSVISSPHFSLYWSVFICFMYNGLPYEKVFSHFKVTSELAHHYFSASHIAEAIVCQNYETKYYAMNWTDHSLSLNKFHASFLGCDEFLEWGTIHTKGIKVGSQALIPTGYVFKKFIKNVINNRENTLKEMGICAKGKVITFFVESFGGGCKMTAENYISFWETALKLCENQPGDTVVMKSKGDDILKGLEDQLRKRLVDIRSQMEKKGNVFIFTSDRWSFIEFIGVSDIAVTQGMTTSATIAIICGVEGLYLDEAYYTHPFSTLFKNKIAFNEPSKLLFMISKIINGAEKPSKNIPEHLLRQYDAYPDARGIDLFRRILSCEAHKRVGIIVQARMGSTRLPGKVMMPVSERPMLEVLCERVRACRNADILIIATTAKERDSVIANLAEKIGIICFRGDEEDLLNRFYGAAKKYCLDAIVRITADCPLADPKIIDDIIDFYLKNMDKYEYVSNSHPFATYPHGLDAEIFGFSLLERLWKEIRHPFRREWFTTVIFENPQRYKIFCLKNDTDLSHIRLTVDYPEDLELIQSIYARLYSPGRCFSLAEVLELLRKNEELSRINQKYKRDEQYEQELTKRRLI